jgi:excisionase family DNA binding protein
MITSEPIKTNVPAFVTISKAAKALACSRRRIRETIIAGQLEAIQLGKRRVVIVSSLLRYLRLESGDVLKSLVQRLSG